MKLIYILLHICLSFLAVASDLPPDIMARSAGITTYTVTAVNRANTYETETLLKGTYGESNVVTERYNGIFMAWKVTSSDGQLAGDIEALSGVQKVESDRVPHDQDRKGAPPSEVENNAHLPRSTVQQGDLSSQSAREELDRRDGEFERYQAFANETVDIGKTEEFLKTKVQKGRTVQPMLRWRDKKLIGWTNIVLDAAALKEVQDHEGIESITMEQKIAPFRATPPYKAHQSQEDTTMTTGLLGKMWKLVRRGLKWVKQSKADKALVMNSQYKGADLSTLQDFVHVSEPGKNTFIYVVGVGIRGESVNGKYEEEFRPPGGYPDRIQVLQTATSVDDGENKYFDEDKKEGHTTYVASKALGSQWGLAKSATLISVKMVEENEDFPVVFELIVNNIKAHPDRAHSSVVLITYGTEKPITQEYLAGKYVQDAYLPPLQELLGLGVPVVCAAGNYALEPGNRKNIDTIPPLLQSEDTPLINVGAADYEGNLVPKSQDGSQVTIYAPGRDVEAQSIHDELGQVTSGTSVAAPQVAGLIATYLSYEQKPWDDSKQGIDRVKAIRDYLTSDASSWERQPGRRMIWNGAKKEHHDSAGTEGAKPPPSNTAPKDPTPPSPPKPQKSMALGIVFSTRTTKNPSSGASTRDNRWLFFTGAVGVPSVCYKQIDAKHMVELKKENGEVVRDPGWPVGTYPLKIDNMDCKYMNDGKGNPGALWCEGREGPIECFEERGRTKEEGVVECEKMVPGDTVLRRGVVYCEW